MPRLVFIVSCLTFLFGGRAVAVETVCFVDHDKTRTVVAEIMVEAQDGGLMLRADDGRIWTIQPEHIKSRNSDPSPLQPIDADEMERRMLAELPEGFQVYRTQHYVILHNSNEAHVKAVGLLFEQLYRGFFTYWKNLKWKLPEPRFPLVALVLADRDSFLTHAKQEIGDTANALIGYYNFQNNRMTTFNVPHWERNAATIIHEATHQLAFNCGLQQRYADNPKWVSEGLATFFESPDRRNPGKWQRIGRINEVQLAGWRRYVRNRPAESLATLLANDSRHGNTATSAAAYAEGWALTYFLIKTRREQYVEYLRELSRGRPLVERTERERIEMFEEAFDTTLVELDRAFVDYMRSI